MQFCAENPPPTPLFRYAIPCKTVQKWDLPCGVQPCALCKGVKCTRVKPESGVDGSYKLGASIPPHPFPARIETRAGVHG